MDVHIIEQVGREALLLALLISAPALLTALVIGLTVSLFQAATQIQEQTLTFVPKLIGICAVIAGLGSCILHLLGRFTVVGLFDKIPYWVH